MAIGNAKVGSGKMMLFIQTKGGASVEAPPLFILVSVV